MSPRPLLRILTLLLPLLGAPPATAAEFDLRLAASGAAPLSDPMRIAGAGFGLSIEATYGPVSWFDLGVRYGAAVFFPESVDAAGDPKGPIVDHGIGAVFALTLASHADAGWLEPGGGMAGELRLDLGVGYHAIGRESRAGLDVALAYDLHLLPDFSLGPFFRAVTVFDTSVGTAAYVLFGLAFGYDIGTAIGDAA
jgi:hypothetical protein